MKIKQNKINQTENEISKIFKTKTMRSIFLLYIVLRTTSRFPKFFYILALTDFVFKIPIIIGLHLHNI